MKTTELRIGNYHLYHMVDKLDERVEWDEVCQIDFDDLRILSEFEDNPEYQPIPLTEEWLLKFGFEGKVSKTSNCGNYYLNYDAEYGHHDMALWYQRGSWCFSHTGRFTVLKYVHQLQNLYFALTGEELTIKK